MIDIVKYIPILNELRNNKLYIYNNYDNNKDPIITKYGCRFVIILNIFHIAFFYYGLYLGFFVKQKKYLIITLILYILFYIITFYTSGCWISLPEIILNDKYHCTDTYTFSNNMWNIRDFLLPNITTTMILYIPLTIYIIYKLFK